MKKPKHPGDLIRKVNAKKNSLSGNLQGLKALNVKDFKPFPTKGPKKPVALKGADLSKFKPFPGSVITRSTSTPPTLKALHKTHKKSAVKCKTCGSTMHKTHPAKKTHKKNWIQGAIKHPGALHRELGVKEGKKIPAKTLARAASKGGVLGRRARLAQTLKGLNK